MAIEDVVRPAQLPTNLPPKTLRQRRASRNWAPVIHRIEASGSPKTASGSVSMSTSYYHKRKPTEKSAKSQTSLGFGGGIGITFP